MVARLSDVIYRLIYVVAIGLPIPRMQENKRIKGIDHKAIVPVII